MKRRAGRLAVTIAALTCAAAVAGCASSGSSQPGASGSTAASPTGQGTTPSASNTPAVAAPSSSSAPAGPPYTQIGLAAKRSTTTPKKLVTLAPGATANALLQIVDALNYPSASCGPTKATALKIYPPNQTEPVYLPNTSSGCAKPVQIMYIGAVRPGSGSSS